MQELREKQCIRLFNNNFHLLRSFCSGLPAYDIEPGRKN